MTIVADVRHACRALMRAPSFSLPIILLLSLGFAATLAAFTAVDTLLRRPLPYADADRLVVVWEHNVPRNRPRNVVGPANFLAWRDGSTSFTEMAMLSQSRVTLTGAGDPEELPALVCSANLLSMLGARPVMGRTMAPGEDQPSARVALLSRGLWERRFGSRPDIVGLTITLNARPVEIIGVLPPDFELFGMAADVWIPADLGPQARTFQGRYALSVGKLRDGVSIVQAEQDLEAIAARLEQERPDFNQGWSVNLVPLREQLVGDVRAPMLAIFAAVVGVLLISCVNVANLMLARLTRRRRELALRASLGAGTRRLLQQLVVEALVIVGCGAAVGMLLAVPLTRWLSIFMSTQLRLPLAGQIAVDPTMVAVAIGAMLATTLLCGLAPALGIGGASLTQAMREGAHQLTATRGGQILQRGLVIAEVAIAITLLVGASLLVRTLTALQGVDPGFTAESVLAMRVIVPGQEVRTNAQEAAFHQQLVERLQALPGVQSVSGTAFLPLAGMGSATSFWRADRPTPEPADRMVTEIRAIMPDYFRTMGITLIRGRDLSASDGSESPLVAVVNEAMVRGHLGDGDPIGKRLTYSWDEPTTVEVVGVVADIKLTSLDGEIRPTMFLPVAQNGIRMMNYVIRTEGDPAALATAGVAAIHSVHPSLPVSNVRTLESVVAASIARPRITAQAAGGFGLAGLLLAAIGVYSVMAYSVSLRMQEFGIRLALGATGGDIVRLVVRQGLLLACGGLAIGLVIAVPMTRLMRTLLFGVQPGDPASIVAAGLVLLAAAAIACYIPARRGMQADPIVTLRAE
jgi:predicted permease